jgi:transglutaminase-like putative cysteine protease
MAMLEPTAAERGWYAVGAGLLAIAGLLGAARLRGAARWAAMAATSLVTIALALLAGGVGDELLRPSNWDALASGIERGIGALPGARVPYRGIDEWTRIVIPLGGTMLTVLAALIAFWPRRATTGFPFAALVLLVTLYAVPAVALDFEGEFLRGALLALLVLAFLRLERLRLTEAGAAAVLATGTAIAALIVAPALDGDAPWWDYETWALSTASSRSTTFSWDHDYGPLDWPRDGREMLRVTAKQAAYWKAQQLDVFDGERWVQSPKATREAFDVELPDDPAIRRRFTQKIRVSVRNLRSRTFITAGISAAPVMPNRAAIPNGPPGIWVSSRTLRRGDTYTANVYTPKPTERELRAAGTFYDRELGNFRTIELKDLPGQNSGTPPGTPAVVVRFREWDLRGQPPEAYRPGIGTIEPRPRDGERAMERSALARTWALSQRLKRGARDPLDYIKAVEAYLGRDFTYTESPPAKSRTLEGFLFDTQSGYCQQYSGAMALLLRMAGIPARVATGFTSGSYDRKSREYVVRDLDAHSWVEAWFPNYGWVTFDPTPSAAPPRSQSSDRGNAAIGDAPDLGGGGALDPRAGLAAEDGTPWELYTALGVLAALVLAGGVAAFRAHRRRPAPLPELERALRRTRRAPGPGATLQALEASFARSPDAQGYVRALRDQRYGGRDVPPTRAQRRGLRTELGRGGGLLGRLRAWWALPPRRSRTRPTLDAHG